MILFREKVRSTMTEFFVFIGLHEANLPSCSTRQDFQWVILKLCWSRAHEHQSVFSSISRMRQSCHVSKKKHVWAVTNRPIAISHLIKRLENVNYMDFYMSNMLVILKQKHLLTYTWKVFLKHSQSPREFSYFKAFRSLDSCNFSNLKAMRGSCVCSGCSGFPIIPRSFNSQASFKAQFHSLCTHNFLVAFMPQYKGSPCHTRAICFNADASSLRMFEGSK